MKSPSRFLLPAVFMLFVSASALSQRASSGNSVSQPAEQPPAAGSTDSVANELGLLRKSLQTLNNRLQAISEELLTPEAKSENESKERLKRISSNFDLLTRAGRARRSPAQAAY